MLRECRVRSNWGTKDVEKQIEIFLDLYIVDFMWQSNLNISDPIETILKDVAEFWKSWKVYTFY